MLPKLNDRARRIANGYVKRLPDIEANFGKQGPATAAIYDDGVLLYVSADPTTEECVSKAVQDFIVEEGRSDDRSVKVFILQEKDWEHALNQTSGLVILRYTDNRQSDWHTIDQYVELIDAPAQFHLKRTVAGEPIPPSARRSDVSQQVTRITRSELIEHLMQEKRYDIEEELACHESHLESLANEDLLTVAEDETDEVFEITDGDG